MGAGPFLAYDSDADLERHLFNLRGHGIQITDLSMASSSPGERRELRFQKGFGAVDGSTGGEAKQRYVYLGCTHAFNPLFWWADMHLLSEIESAMLAAGSRQLWAPPDEGGDTN